MSADKDLALHIDNVLGHHFNDIDLLTRALTHRSFGRDHNERLEFLGDALLGMVIAAELYMKFPQAAESALTRLRASLVKQEALAQLARQLELGNYIRFGSGEYNSGGKQKESLLANAVEALIGAIYLDSGLDNCRRSIRKMYASILDELTAENIPKDPKSELQEYLQANKKSLPAYHVIAEEGTAHNRLFTISCDVDGVGEPIVAKGRRKRNAEQTAARKALKMIAADADQS